MPLARSVLAWNPRDGCAKSCQLPLEFSLLQKSELMESEIEEKVEETLRLENGDPHFFRSVLFNHWRSSRLSVSLDGVKGIPNCEEWDLRR